MNKNYVKFITEAKDLCVFFDGSYKNLAKEEYSINSGYKFLFIIDKYYNDFESYISSSHGLKVSNPTSGYISLIL